MRDLHTSAMSLTPWHTFVEVCRTGSLSRAALALGYTQSAVSRQIAGLERDFGVALLERLPRGVRPTTHGHALLRHANLLVAELDRARISVAAAAQGSPPLPVGGVPSSMIDLLPRAIAAAAEVLPGHRVTLTVGSSADLEERVRRGGLDVAVVTDYPPGLAPDDQLRRVRIVEDEMLVILPGAHPLAGHPERAVDLAELADEVWVEDNAGSATVLAHAAARAGFAPRTELEVGDLTGKIALVAAGLGVALVPGLLASTLRPEVTVRRLADPPVRTVFASTRAERRPDDRAAQVFVACLQRSAGPNAASGTGTGTGSSTGPGSGTRSGSPVTGRAG